MKSSRQRWYLKQKTVRLLGLLRLPFTFLCTEALVVLLLYLSGLPARKRLREPVTRLSEEGPHTGPSRDSLAAATSDS